MSKRYCKEECEFLHNDFDKDPKCLIYKKKIDTDDKGYLRLETCVQESREWKIGAQIEDLHDYYDAFVCEMDIMFDNLQRLMKGEKNDG